MTRKLYYENAYIKDFEAAVLSVAEEKCGFSVVLDKTAFFPEQGGQSADSGKIGDAKVLAVNEREGVVYHLTDKAPGMGVVSCSLDFEKRFEKMQIHTAEHILSGILNKKYGAENTGFHLGDEVVTLDTDIPLTLEMLNEVEREANRAVFENRPVKCFFPTPPQAEAMSYRSKMQIKENLRLVEVEGVDICACCAPHVSYTGEIGLIKIISAEKHKGGMRIFITAGQRAYEFVSEIQREATKISNMLAVPQTAIAKGVEEARQKAEGQGFMLKEAYRRIAELYARSVDEGSTNLLTVLEGVDMDALIHFSNLAAQKTSGVLVALLKSADSFKYVIRYDEQKKTELIKKANAALGGRGGGRAGMAQGSFSAELSAIKEFFEGCEGN